MKIKELRALSLIQPRAAMMMDEGGSVEERSWTTHLRGYIAIHASSTFKRSNFKDTSYEPDELDYGAIVGFARLDEVEGEKGDYGLCFCDVIKLKEPIEVKGMMNLWRLEGRELQKCLSQLNSRQLSRIEASIQ
jgi:hypothetical protein